VPIKYPAISLKPTSCQWSETNSGRYDTVCAGLTVSESGFRLNQN